MRGFRPSRNSRDPDSSEAVLKRSSATEAHVFSLPRSVVPGMSLGFHSLTAGECRPSGTGASHACQPMLAA